MTLQSIGSVLRRRGLCLPRRIGKDLREQAQEAGVGANSGLLPGQGDSQQRKDCKDLRDTLSGASHSRLTFDTPADGPAEGSTLKTPPCLRLSGNVSAAFLRPRCDMRRALGALICRTQRRQ